MKRHLTVLIAACLLAATGIAGAQNAPNATPASDFKYDLTDDADGVVITRYIGNAAEVVIPAEIEDFPVLELADECFKDCTSLQKVVLPKTLKTIGNEAFTETGLESLAIPDSVSAIGYRAFSSCENLKTVTLGKGIKNIEWYTFTSCTALKAVTFSAGIECIDRAAFSGCSALKTIILPDSIKVIRFNAFKESGLEAIVIPDSVEGIWSEAFKDCKNLKTITIGNGTQRIMREAFAGCTNLTTVTIGKGIKAIENNAFENCSSLTTVNLGVKELPKGDGYDDVFKYGDNNFDFPFQKLADYDHGYGNDVFSGSRKSIFV